MSNIQLFTDMTGQMSHADINSHNINNLISELNRTSDQLDSLNQTLNIVAYGSLSYNWDGSGSGPTPTQATLTTGIQTQGNYTGLSFMSRNIDNPTVYITMPYFRPFVNGSGDTVIDKWFQSEVNALNGAYQVDLNFFATGAPINYTFYYLIFQQPANITQ